MNILILNGSPRENGNTKFMIDSFIEGLNHGENNVNIVSVCQKTISGCISCEYCHTKEKGKCVQNDDMQDIYYLLKNAQMLILASPIYHHNFSGQLQCAVNRMYALGKI